MKKLLLTSAAICGLAIAAAPAAHAEVDLEIGGYAKVYGAFTDHDEVANGSQANDFDFVRDTELHFTGQTTLDNGLTVGAHIEAEVDNQSSDTTAGGDNFDVDESYIFMSGNWGRVNVGAEDGAAYLLQVAAPSADSNIDGIRQYVNPINTNVLTNNQGSLSTDLSLDYDQDITGKSDKITYMTPVFSGFQAGLSYTPDSDGAAEDLEGVGTDDVDEATGAGYELAVRYEGQFDQVGFILGAGYSQTELEEDIDAQIGEDSDDRTAWNVGLDLDIGPFGVGVVYLEDDNGEIAATLAGPVATNTAATVVDDEETFVIGADYTTGNYKFGVSYLETENYGGTQDLDASRWALGAQYTYGPGMTFNGSVGMVEYEGASVDLNSNGTIGAGETNQDVEATYVLIGTQINF